MRFNPLQLLLLAHLAATLFMTGVIWFVQVVHYRLFDRVGRENYAAYAALHARLTTFVVAPPMLLELATGLLIWRYQPFYAPSVTEREAWLGLGLLGVIWFSTTFLQVPQHNTLARGFEAGAYRALVGTNWIRVIAWTLRAALALWWTARLLR